MRFGNIGLVALVLVAGCGSSTNSADERAGSSRAGAGNTGATIGSAGAAAASNPSAQVVVSPRAREFTGRCDDLIRDTDLTWETGREIAVRLNDAGTEAASASVTVNGNIVSIGAAGTYRISGSLRDGQLRIDASDSGVVRLILDGAQIASSSNAALHVVRAKQVIVILADGTQNGLVDSSSYDSDAEANAALFSQADLVIAGDGTLTVQGQFNDGITSKDRLVIQGTAVNVTAVDDGIRGKDCLLVRDSSLKVASGGDGLKSDNTQDPSLGHISIQSGVFDITAGGDGIAAETALYITDGTFSLKTGGGSAQIRTTDISSKGLKGVAGVVIDGGTLALDTADDAVHSNGAVYLNGGRLLIAAGDDGIHSDGLVRIDGPTINVTQSYEGIEGTVITVESGNIHIRSSDDGFNASDGSGAGLVQGIPGGAGGAGAFGVDPGANPAGVGGAGAFGTMGAAPNGRMGPGAAGAMGFGFPGTPPNQTASAGTTSMPFLGFAGVGNIDPATTAAGAGNFDPATTAAGTDTSATGATLLLTFHGGQVSVDASGDGLDSNGSIVMTAGSVLVSGPTDDMNGAIDIGDGPGNSFVISGGLLVAAGSAGMAVAPSASSLQHSVLVTTRSNTMGAGPMGHSTSTTGAELAAGTLVHIENTQGARLVTFAPAKSYASLVFSSPELSADSYRVFVGGTCDGVATDSLYGGGSYSSGTEKAAFAVDAGNSVTTAIWNLP